MLALVQIGWQQFKPTVGCASLHFEKYKVFKGPPFHKMYILFLVPFTESPFFTKLQFEPFWKNAKNIHYLFYLQSISALVFKGQMEKK